MKFLLLCLFGTFHISIFAQDLLSSSGAHHQTNTVQVSWSIGEISIADYSGTNFNWTEGVHQPIIPLSGMTLEEGLDNPQAFLYPNPVHDELFIQSEDGNDFTRFEIVDGSGKILINKDLKSDTQSVMLSSLVPGIYFLNIYNKVSLALTYKIIKE
jgi:hypothetical protein